MAQLSAQVQTFIVIQLAQFSTPTEIVKMVKEEFGIDVAKQTVHHYDPDHGEPAKGWRKLYTEERARFLAEERQIGVKHRNFRLARLDRMLRKAELTGNLALAREILETAAKEEGGAFTNKRHVQAEMTIDQALSQVEDGGGA